MSRADRTIRLALGSALLYIALFHGRLIDNLVLQVAAGLFGLANLVSVLTGICPAYSVTGLSTLRRPSHPLVHVGAGRGRGGSEVVPLQRRLVLVIALSMAALLGFFLAVSVQLKLRNDVLARAADGESVLRMVAELERESAGVGLSPARRVILERALSGTDVLIFHDRDGGYLPSVHERLPADPASIETVLHRFTLAEASARDSRRDTLELDGVPYVLSSMPVSRAVEEPRVWMSTLTPRGTAGELFSILRSPMIAMLILVVLWFGIWTSVYVTRTFSALIRESAKELQHRQRHDPLTGLPNRLMLEEVVGKRLASTDPYRSCLAVMTLDLVGFKDINDTLGYALGDRLLIDVADDLRTLNAEGVDVLRIGADVFCLICTTGHDRALACHLANRLHDRVESHTELDSVPLSLQARIGIAFHPLDSDDAVTLIRHADIALNQAKRSRIKTSHYQHEKDSHSVRKLTLLARLRTAIENDELSLVYQPKIDIESDALVGVEALVRWNDADFGAVSPVEFVGWAEKSGLINRLTVWVLRQVERQSLAWRADGLRIPIAVNLSPMNLHDEQLPALVESLVVGGALDDGLLELELTENAVMEDPAKALSTMNRLHALGVRFAIDDFGTGLSSFAYLRRFPVSHLKIDRSFVADTEDADRDSVLLRSMIDLGHSLGCVVTAEGVEDAETIDKLREHGCDYVQGYFSCRPVPAEELRRWMADREEVVLARAA